VGSKSQANIINVFLISAIFLISIIIIAGAQQTEEYIPFNSTYKYYGYNPQENMFTNWDGLRYVLLDNGGIKILNQGNQPILTYGIALSGDYGVNKIIKTELDYQWTWSHTTKQITFSRMEENETGDLNNISYVMTRHIFEGDNNNNKLRIIQRYEFDPLNYVKITQNITNNFNDITNAKFWYIIKDTGIIRYDGQNLNIKNSNINRVGNFNNILSKIAFSDGTFIYEDLLNDGFDLTNIRVGSGEIIGLPNVSLIGLGFSKGNGNFVKGTTVILDPTSTGFKFGTSTGDPPGSGWTNPDNSILNDGVYATSISVGSILYTKGYSFGLSGTSEIVGFEMQLNARAESGSPCPIKTGSKVAVNMSLNNYTSNNSDEKISPRFNCVFGGAPADTTYTLGNSLDLWGFPSGMTGSDINSSFRTSLRHSRIQTIPFNPGFDAQAVNIYWETMPPTLSNNNGLNGQDLISSTFLINISADQNLTSAFLESNYTGVFVNYSLTEEGDTNNWFRFFEGNNNSNDGDEGANNDSTLAYTPAINRTFSITGCVSTSCTVINLGNITAISSLPSIILNNPLNNSDMTGNTSIIFNITNNDSDDDRIDLIITSSYGNGFDIRNYIQFFESVTNETEAVFNLSTGTIDANEQDLSRLFRMDNLNRFDESVPINTLVYDFSNNNINATRGNANDVPETCTSRTINPLQEECLEFDGGESLEVTNGTDSEIGDIIEDLNFSITFWGYDRSSATNIALAKGKTSGSPIFLLVTNNFFRIYNNTDDLICNAFMTVPLNKWKHTSWVGDGTNVTGYLDGVKKVTVDCTSDVINLTRWVDEGSAYSVFIGGAGAIGASSAWDGALDMFSIWDRTLTETEVINIYNVSRNPFLWSTKQWDSPEGETGNNFTFNTAVSDSCTYTSGNWLVNFADNCIITSNIVGDSLADIIFSGAGSFTINDAVIVSGFDYLFAPDTGIIKTFGTGGLRLQ